MGFEPTPAKVKQNGDEKIYFLPIATFVGLMVIGVAGQLDKILSEELQEECEPTNGDKSSIENCLIMEIKGFCKRRNAKNDVEQALCNMLEMNQNRSNGWRIEGIFNLY